MRLLPEIHSANLILEECRYRDIPATLSWNHAAISIRVGNLLLQPCFDSVKVWLGKIVVGCFQGPCSGEFLGTDFRNLLLSQKVSYGQR